MMVTQITLLALARKSGNPWHSLMLLVVTTVTFNSDLQPLSLLIHTSHTLQSQARQEIFIIHSIIFAFFHFADSFLILVVLGLLTER